MATRVNARFMDGRDNEFQTRPQLINESISKLNDALSEGRYFYVEILAQGIMLYDSGEYRLATPRELDYAEIKGMAEAYLMPKISYFMLKSHKKGELIKCALSCCIRQRRTL